MNRKGSISLVVLLSGLVLIMITMSLMTIQINEVKAVQSSRQRICAQYVAESAMELAVWELYEITEEIIQEYVNGAGTHQGMMNQGFDNYLKHRLYHQLPQFNVNQPAKLMLPVSENGENNPSHEDHLIRMKVEKSTDQQQLILTVQGICGRARSTLQSVLDLPQMTGQYVSSLYLVSTRQILSDWP